MYVYIIQSKSNSNKYYIGCTSNLKERLKKHNQNEVAHTKKYSPWKIIVGLWFIDEKKAWDFEKYLKTGSGWAFRKRHF